MIPRGRQLKLNGRSGCTVLLKEYEEYTAVRKASAALTYNHRMRLQMLKQEAFLHYLPKLNDFIVPRIYSSGYDEKGLFYFEMQYIHGDKFSDFFSKISISQISLLVKTIQDYFEKAFELSDPITVSRNIIIKKVEEVFAKINSNASFPAKLKEQAYKILITQIPSYPLPTGICHGDFTFSNMLFGKDNQIYIFDFLDSFLESPIIDLVKLKQDTRFNWSLVIDVELELYKTLKVRQVLKYLDKKMDAYLDSMGNENRLWYKYLEFLNLVRIMPYVTVQNEIDFLVHNIDLLIKEQ